MRVQNECIEVSRFRKQQVTELEKHINLKRSSKIKSYNLSSSQALKQCPGAGQENIMVLAGCSASGVTLDPLILYKGKQIQENW